jgi:hypothetical protein
MTGDLSARSHRVAIQASPWRKICAVIKMLSMEQDLPSNAIILPVENCLRGMTIASATSMSNMEIDHLLPENEFLSTVEIASHFQPLTAVKNPINFKHSRTEKKRNSKEDNDQHSSLGGPAMILSSSTFTLPHNSRLSMEPVNTSMYAYRTCSMLWTPWHRCALYKGQERGSHRRHGYYFETSQARDRDYAWFDTQTMVLIQPHWGYFGRLYFM